MLWKGRALFVSAVVPNIDVLATDTAKVVSRVIGHGPLLLEVRGYRNKALTCRIGRSAKSYVYVGSNLTSLLGWAYCELSL
jgi:hypothetical protein